jgi:hypothetical protein
MARQRWRISAECLPFIAFAMRGNAGYIARALADGPLGIERTLWDGRPLWICAGCHRGEMVLLRAFGVRVVRCPGSIPEHV